MEALVSVVERPMHRPNNCTLRKLSNKSAIQALGDGRMQGLTLGFKRS